MPDVNGQLPRSALAPIPGGMLRRDAAAAFLAMSAESQRRFHVALHPEGPLGSYRDLAGQRKLYKIHQEGGPLAAVPGTSNHGKGLAVDFPPAQIPIVNEIGAPFGWSKRWSDAPSETWHFVYKPGLWHGHAAPVEPPHVVAVAQQLLRAHGDGHLVIDGRLDAATLRAVKEFQRLHGLTVDGIPGPRTIAALRKAQASRTHRGRKPAAPPRHHAAPAAPEPAERPQPTPPPTSTPARRPALPHPHLPHRRPVDPPSIPTGGSTVPADSPFPLNRVIAFLGPYVALASGVLAAWLGRHFPGLQLDEGQTAAAITQAGYFTVGALITWALHHKFLDGWQKWEAGTLAASAALGPDPGAATPEEWADAGEAFESGLAVDDEAVWTASARGE